MIARNIARNQLCDKCGFTTIVSGQIHQFPTEKDGNKVLLCRQCWTEAMTIRKEENKRTARRRRKLVVPFPYK